MGTFLTVVLVILAIVALLGLVAAFWVRSKLRKAKVYLIYGGLTLAVQALKERAAMPEHAEDQELAAQLKRAEAAERSAKEALDKGELDEAVKIMLPVLQELGKYKNALDQERAQQAAQGQVQNSADVIDVVAEEVKPVLELPAPTVSSQADAPVDAAGSDAAGSVAAGSVAAGSVADSAAQVDTTVGAGSADKPASTADDSKK